MSDEEDDEGVSTHLLPLVAVLSLDKDIKKFRFNCRFKSGDRQLRRLYKFGFVQPAGDKNFCLLC